MPVDKNRATLVLKTCAAVLFVAAGIIYVTSVREKDRYQSFPVSKDNIAVGKALPAQGNDNADDRTGDMSDTVTEEAAVTPLLVDINSAGSEELKLLPGIGEKKAAAIIEYRSTQGNFSSTEEIMLVPGIKDGIFSKISEFIYVNEEVSDDQEDSGGR